MRWTYREMSRRVLRGTEAIAPQSRLLGGTLLAIIPLIVGAGLLGVTSERSYSPAITSDSIAYIESARWFAAGQGIVRGEPGSLRPMTHFPPLYSIVLAAGTMLGHAAERTAAVLHPFCLALTLFFVGGLVLRLGGSIATAVATQWLAALSWELVAQHLVVQAEALFMALAFGAIYLLTEHNRRESLAYLVCAAVLLGLATMTRFAGLGIVCGAAAYLAWSSRHRLRDPIIILFCGVAPFILWTLSHRSDGLHGIDRRLGPVAPAMWNLELGVRTLGEFILPFVWPGAKVYLFALMMLGILAVGVYWRRTRILGTISFGYMALVVFSLIFVDRDIPLSPRILSPILLLAIAIVAVTVAVALRSVQDSRSLAFVVCVLLVFTVDYADYRRSQVSMLLPYDVQHGVGYEARKWHNSPILARVMEQPVDMLLVSPNPPTIHFLIGRASLRTPAYVKGPDDSQVLSLARRIKGRRAMYVDYPRISENRGNATAREMSKWFELTLIAEERDGGLYLVSAKGDNPSAGEASPVRQEGSP